MLLLLLCLVVRVAADDVEVVRSRVIEAILPRAPIPRVDVAVESHVASLGADGLWKDVNYSDAGGRSWWATGVHLQRASLLAIAYRSNHSTHYNNKTYLDGAQLSLRAWMKHDFINSNWWWNDIGTPRCIAKLLLLVGSAADLSVAATILDRGSLAFAKKETGCNRVWVASVNIMRGALEGGASGRARMVEAYDIVHSAIRVGTQRGDGIQTDASFHQHGPQLYTGWGYGAIYTANVLLTEEYAAGTNFSMSSSAWDVFSTLVVSGHAQTTRGPNFDFAASGRLMTYYAATDSFGVNEGHYHYFAAFTDFALAFPSFEAPLRTPLAVVFAPLLPRVASSRARAPELMAYYDRIMQRSGEGLTSSHHFYDSDYVVHHRPGFMASVRMFSNRTINTECINGENLQGYDLADGVFTVVRTGQEYEGVFPVWQWRRIPGTTELQNNETYHLCTPVPDEVGVTHTSWVGGLSDKEYSIAVMDFQRHEKTAMVGARKAWMLFDDGGLALGANITATTAQHHMSTSLDQRLLKGEVHVGLHNGSTVVIPPETTRWMTDIAWVWHDSVAYLMMKEQANVTVSTRTQHGSLSAITQGPAKPLSLKVFSLHIDHGVVEAVAGSYRYFVAPAPLAAAPSLADALAANLTVLDHSGGRQSLCRRGERSMMQAIVWPEHVDGVIEGATQGCWNVRVNHPCLLQLVENDNGALLTVSNPNVEVRPLTIAVVAETVRAGTCRVNITLPKGALAGQSVSTQCTFV